MGNVIQIKRGTTIPPDGALAEGELGFNKQNNTLYIGTSDHKSVLIGMPPDEVNLEVQANWAETNPNAPSYISNKPDLIALQSAANNAEKLANELQEGFGELQEEVGTLKQGFDNLRPTTDEHINALIDAKLNEIPLAASEEAGF